MESVRSSLGATAVIDVAKLHTEIKLTLEQQIESVNPAFLFQELEPELGA